MVLRSFGSDCPVVIGPTGAGPGMDPLPSPIEADSLWWLGIRAIVEQGEAVGVLWSLILLPYLAGLPGVSGFLVGRDSILSSRYNPQHPPGAWHTLGAQ